MSEFDDIARPFHYVEGRKFEPKDVIRDWDLNFFLGSCVKYIARAGRTGNLIEDLKKARQYLTFEIDYIEMKNDSTRQLKKFADGIDHELLEKVLKKMEDDLK